VAKKTAQSAPRFNLSVQTLRLAHQALIGVPKTTANDMGLCANAMQEIEVVLAALPQDMPPADPAIVAPDEIAPPAPKGKSKGKNKRK
jgi:hypothetical protein